MALRFMWLLAAFIAGVVASRVFVQSKASGIVELREFESVWIRLEENGSRLEISDLISGKRKIGIVEKSGSVPLTLDYSNAISNVIRSNEGAGETRVVFDKDGDGIPEVLMKLGNGEGLYDLELLMKKVSKNSNE